MAIETPCQTSGVQFHTWISGRVIECKVELPMELYLTEEEADILEANLHNVLELVLARYFSN